MNFGIDGNEANIDKKVGVGWYAFNTLQALSKSDENHVFHIFLKYPPRSDMPPATKNWQYHVFGPKPMWTRFSLPLHLLTQQPKLNCFYSPSHYSPIFSPCPVIPTIHDIGYLQFQKEFTPKDLYQLIHWTKDSIRHASHIIAVSQFTKNELISAFKIPEDKISIAYNGVGEPPSIISDCRFTQPFFLALGTLKPNKNYPFLVRAFSAYLKQTGSHDLLVIAGKKGWLFDEIFNTVKQEKLESKIVFTDYITENEKWSFLKHTLALVIPSTYEGFGIPAVEAQKTGTPVIASNIPPLKEVLQDSALFIHPQRISTLVNALITVKNDKVRNPLIKKGYTNSLKFTWDNTAQSVLNSIIKTCMNTSDKK